MMHRDERPRRRGRDFEYPNERVFEDNFVTDGRGFDGVVAVGVLRFVLSVEIKSSRGHHKRNRDYNADQSSSWRKEEPSWEGHAARYNDFIAESEVYIRISGGASGVVPLNCQWQTCRRYSE